MHSCAQPAMMRESAGSREPVRLWVCKASAMSRAATVTPTTTSVSVNACTTGSTALGPGLVSKKMGAVPPAFYERNGECIFLDRYLSPAEVVALVYEPAVLEACAGEEWFTLMLRMTLLPLLVRVSPPAAKSLLAGFERLQERIA